MRELRLLGILDSATWTIHVPRKAITLQRSSEGDSFLVHDGHVSSCCTSATVLAPLHRTYPEIESWAVKFA